MAGTVSLLPAPGTNPPLLKPSILPPVFLFVTPFVKPPIAPPAKLRAFGIAIAANKGMMGLMASATLMRLLASCRVWSTKKLNAES